MAYHSSKAIPNPINIAINERNRRMNWIEIIIAVFFQRLQVLALVGSLAVLRNQYPRRMVRIAEMQSQRFSKAIGPAGISRSSASSWELLNSTSISLPSKNLSAEVKVSIPPKTTKIHAKVLMYQAQFETLDWAWTSL